jgi:hypothetical protein
MRSNARGRYGKHESSIERGPIIWRTSSATPIPESAREALFFRPCRLKGEILQHFIASARVVTEKQPRMLKIFSCLS